MLGPVLLQGKPLSINNTEKLLTGYISFGINNSNVSIAGLLIVAGKNLYDSNSHKD
jgi:hypothetical protein